MSILERSNCGKKTMVIMLNWYEILNPGKLHQEMMGYRKKNKLENGTVTLEELSGWLGK